MRRPQQKVHYDNGLRGLHQRFREQPERSLDSRELLELLANLRA